jgi:hypothetical protein
MRLDELKRGMLMRTLDGQGHVATIVQMAILHGKMLLRVTPWHLIFVEWEGTSMWVFPASVIKPEPMACDAVDLVKLDKAEDVATHSVSISGMWCITLGHGLMALESGDTFSWVIMTSCSQIWLSWRAFLGAYPF